MDFLELARKRESCRAYIDKPVDRQALVKMVEAAMMSPSACNSQPWRFIIVDDKKRVMAMAPFLEDKLFSLNKFVWSVPAFIVIVESNANLSSKFGGKFKDQAFAQMDIGIAAQSICLAAASMNLGTCIMGSFEEKKLKALLGVPLYKRIRLVLSVGYPLHEMPREKARKAFAEMVSFNTWQSNE